MDWQAIMGQDMVAGAFTAALAILAVVVVAVMTVRSLIVIVPPNRAAVLTGRTRQLPSGERIGMARFVRIENPHLCIRVARQ